jgi:hypothetical protein
MAIPYLFISSFNLAEAPGLYKLQIFQVANFIFLSLFRLHGRLPTSIRHILYGS